MRALAWGDRGVSGRAMRSASTGMSGAYLRASRAARGPLVWIRPTPLSVKSDALITRAHGFAARLSATWARYWAVPVSTGLPFGVGDRVDERGDPRAELPGQGGDGRGPAAGRQAAGVVLDRVVQQGGADDVGIVDAVVADDPQRHAQQVVDVRLALAAVSGVQPPGQIQRPLRPAAAVRVGQPGDLGGEPGPQPRLPVHRRHDVQRHHRQQLSRRVTVRQGAACRLTRRAGTLCLAAFAVGVVPGSDQFPVGVEDPVAGLRNRERGELVTALHASQVAGVVPGLAAQPGQRQAALVS